MSDQVTEWWLVRHAPVANPDDLAYGILDLGVILPPEAHFRSLSAMLPDDPAWMVSNLSRTRLTLDAILGARGVDDAEIFEEPDFAEQHFGDWEGRSRLDLWDELNDAGMSWHEMKPPGGERFSEVAERVSAAAETWSRRLRGRSVVAVIHAGSVRGFLAAALGVRPQAVSSFMIDTLSVTRCDRFDADAWRVLFVNRLAS